jgi:hypothetical protein
LHAGIVLIPLLLLAVASTRRGAPVAPLPEIAHSDHIVAYAAAVVSVQRAEKICSGYQSKPTALAALRGRMAIRDRDETELSERMLEIERSISGQIDKVGIVSWCAVIVEFFGPNGTLSAGLLDAR